MDLEGTDNSYSNINSFLSTLARQSHGTARTTPVRTNPSSGEVDDWTMQLKIAAGAMELSPGLAVAFLIHTSVLNVAIILPLCMRLRSETASLHHFASGMGGKHSMNPVASPLPCEESLTTSPHFQSCGQSKLFMLMLVMSSHILRFPSL